MKHVVYLPPHLHNPVFYSRPDTKRKSQFETIGNGRAHRTALLAEEVIEWCRANLSGEYALTAMPTETPDANHVVMEFDRLDDATAFETEWVSSGRAPARIRCHAGRDGDCFWEHCPQLRDNEPRVNGRHCPRDVHYEDEDY